MVQNFEICMSSKPINAETHTEYVNVQKMEKLFKTQETLIVEEKFEVALILNVEIPAHKHQ